MEDWSKYGLGFRYSMLNRLKQDCEYYLSYGNGNPKYLWAEDEQSHIENMAAIWKSFELDERPEWFSWGDIVYYSVKMGVRFYTGFNYTMYFRKNREDDDE